MVGAGSVVTRNLPSNVVTVASSGTYRDSGANFRPGCFRFSFAAETNYDKQCHLARA